MSDPEAVAAQLAQIEALPSTGRTRMIADRMRSLVAMFAPSCPTRDLLAEEDNDEELIPWDWLDLDGAILHQRLVEMRERGELDDQDDDKEAEPAEESESLSPAAG